MANTLKFGNGQFATKKGSTLAYNDENGNFKPLPFDFTRASSATVINKAGLIETVGNGQPRIDYKDNTNGALLLEPQRSNYILKSDDVLSTYQSQNGDVSDASEPINGFDNSIQIEYDASSNSLVYKRDFNPTIGTEYTVSLFVQMNDNSEPIHTVDANSGDFSLINNNSFASASDIKTERLGSTNVYRVSATKTATDTNNRFGVIKYSTQSSKGFKVTGFQLEQGSYATSYIPTQGSAVTRVADVCNNAGNDQVINSTEGVLYAEISALTSGGLSRAISINDGTTSNRINLFFPSNLTDVVGRVNSQGNLSADMTYNNITQTLYNKIAVKWKINDFSLWVNGVEVATDSSGAVPIGLSEISFNNASTTLFLGNTKDLRIYNTALTDAELQALTTI